MPPTQVRDRPPGLDSPWVRTLIKHGSRVQTWIYQRTNGRLGSHWRIGSALRRPVDVLLLDHVGRRSGTTYTIPLLYLEDGDNLVVVASQGGRRDHPQWYRNLLTTPDTQVQVRAALRRVRARVAEGEERALLWPKLVDLYADYASYQAWTDREIPVVVLEPR